MTVLATSEISLPFVDLKKKKHTKLKIGTKEEIYFIPVSCLKKQQGLFTKMNSFPR